MQLILIAIINCHSLWMGPPVELYDEQSRWAQSMRQTDRVASFDLRIYHVGRRQRTANMELQSS